MARVQMDSALDDDLRRMKDRLLIMGSRCERMVLVSARCFDSADGDEADEMWSLRRQIRTDERLVDEIALRLLARRWPVGRDLRFTFAGLKVCKDLHWIADELVHMAEPAPRRAPSGGVSDPWSWLVDLDRRVGATLHRALGAFVGEDAEEARGALRTAEETSELAEHVFRESARLMEKDSGRIPEGMRLAANARHLERVGRHAAHIAEMVIFLALGVDVRHAEAG